MRRRSDRERPLSAGVRQENYALWSIEHVFDPGPRPVTRAAPPRQAQITAGVRSEVLRLSRAPFHMSAQKLAEQFGLSKRTIFRIRAEARAHEDTSQPDPVDTRYAGSDVVRSISDRYWAWREFADMREEVPADVLAGVVDAFRDWYVRYTGFEYLPAHAEEWVRLFFEEPRLLLNVPPRHAKSEIITVWTTVFEICMDRNIQIIIISETATLAKKFSNKIAWHLEYNRKLIADYGRFAADTDDTPWRPLSGELMVMGRDRETQSGDLTVQIRGAGQQVLGMEADRIKGDDVVGRDSASSEAARDKLSEYWAGDVMTRQSPVGRVAVIGQRIHFQDLYGELAEKKYTRGPRQGDPLWAHVNYPAIKDWDTGEVLWPEEWPFERLLDTYEDMKRRHNSWLFESMYQQNPIPPEGRLVMPEWILGDDQHPGCLDRSRPAGAGMTWVMQEGEEPDWWVRVVSLDPSPERQAGLIVADVYHSRDVFRCGIIEATRQRMDVREMMRQIARVTDEYRPTYLIFEQNAAQRWFLQDIEFIRWRNSHNVRVIAHTTGKHKTDPVYGLQSLAVAFEYGRIRLPWADEKSREMCQVLIDEATTYPYGPYSDLLMALWFIAFNHAKLTPPPKPLLEAAGAGWRVPKHLEKGWGGFTR